MRRWLIVAAVLLWSVAGLAQTPPAPRLQWTWAADGGMAVSYFTCVIDSGTPASLGLPTPVGTTYTVLLSLCGTMTAGTHLLVVQACNDAGTVEATADDSCTDSAALTVVKQ